MAEPDEKGVETEDDDLCSLVCKPLLLLFFCFSFFEEVQSGLVDVVDVRLLRLQYQDARENATRNTQGLDQHRTAMLHGAAERGQRRGPGAR